MTDINVHLWYDISHPSPTSATHATAGRAGGAPAPSPSHGAPRAAPPSPRSGPPPPPPPPADPSGGFRRPAKGEASGGARIDYTGAWDAVSGLDRTRSGAVVHPEGEGSRSSDGGRRSRRCLQDRPFGRRDRRPLPGGGGRTRRQSVLPRPARPTRGAESAVKAATRGLGCHHGRLDHEAGTPCRDRRLRDGRDGRGPPRGADNHGRIGRPIRAGQDAGPRGVGRHQIGARHSSHPGKTGEPGRSCGCVRNQRLPGLLLPCLWHRGTPKGRRRKPCGRLVPGVQGPGPAGGNASSGP